MTRGNFSIIEDEDCIVIYDESDDYVPEEERVYSNNDELDIDYLIPLSRIQDSRAAAEKHSQRLVSACVIVAVVTFVTTICYINFRSVLF